MEHRGWAHCKACDACYSPRINETCYRESGRVEYEVLCNKCLGIAEEAAYYSQLQYEEQQEAELVADYSPMEGGDERFIAGFMEDKKGGGRDYLNWKMSKYYE